MPSSADQTAEAAASEAIRTPTRREALPKPLLASEVMVGDRAPLEPWRPELRITLAIVAVTLMGLGLAVWSGVGMPRGTGPLCFGAASACLLIAALPFPYAVRAALVVGLGLGSMVLGLRGTGPLAGLAVDGGELRDLVRLLVGTVLPAALFVRARYPTYPATRWILAAAFVAALPLLWLEARLVLDSGVPGVVRAAAASFGVALLVSVAGFAGDGSLGHASPWAWLVLATLPLEIAARELSPLADAESGWMTYPATGLAIVCMTAITSQGVAQLIATLVGPRARAHLRQQLRPGSERRLNDSTA